MAICPFAVQELITIDSAGRGHTPVRMTLHTAVSSAVDLYKGKPASNGTYAHFYCNELGTIYQYKDTSIAARADAQGNSGSISVETWDGGKEQPWNAKQLAAIARLFQWVTSTHSTVPNRLASVHDLKGLAWHRLGCTGNFGTYSVNDITTWSGNQSGAVWSNSRGKTCPYDTRIRQIPGILNIKIASTTNASTTTASTGKHASTRYARAIDGSFGAYTVKSWQAWLTRRGYYTRAIDGVMGIESWKAVQRWLTKDGYYNRAIDGQAGTYTVKGLQKALQNAGYYTAYTVDGQFGTQTVKALQSYLSTHD